MAGFPFEEGVLTPLENDRLNTAFGIIRGVIQDSVESSIELGFNAKKRCHFCGKPVVEKHKDILKVQYETIYIKRVHKDSGI